MIAPHNDRGEMLMDPIVIALAQAAGLDKALALYPEDVAAAAEQALAECRHREGADRSGG